MDKGFENIILKKEEGVATITLNRPQVRNALDMKTFQELKEAIEGVRTDKEVRAIILAGAETAFCSGVDVSMLGGMAGVSLSDLRASIREIHKIINSIEEMEKPVIAAVNGYALGGGCDLALACDLRIASEDAIFGEEYIKLGLVPDMGGTQRLPRLVGVAKAKELIFTGDRIDAMEAGRIGLVNKVVPKEELQSEAMNLAQKLAKGPSVAIGLAKIAINKGMEGDSRTGMEYEAHAQSLCVQTKDVMEGVTARLEKRPPQFKGE